MRIAIVLSFLSLVLTVGCTQNLSGQSCDDGLTSCDGTCVNLQADGDNCGACGTVCGTGETCNEGACEAACPADQVSCGGACIDPQNNGDYCGATGDCQGGNQGQQCGTGQACQAGACDCAPGYQECVADSGVCYDLSNTDEHCGACFNACPANATCQNSDCVSNVIIAGALPPGNGRWTYGGQVGIAGADAECSLNWANSYACTRTELEAAAAALPTSQLAGLSDTQGTTVPALWVDDETAVDALRCVDATQENIPWTYMTAHIGHMGYYSTLDNAAGTMGPVTVGMCNTGMYHVACCFR